MGMSGAFAMYFSTMTKATAKMTLATNSPKMVGSDHGLNLSVLSVLRVMATKRHDTNVTRVNEPKKSILATLERVLSPVLGRGIRTLSHTMVAENKRMGT